MVELKDPSLPLPKHDGLVVIDVSGLTKPWIFRMIRQELIRSGRVIVCHASAESYYPLAEDLERLFGSDKLDDPLKFLESLAEVLTGEEPPYKEVRLLNEKVDPSRKRGLLAFGSSKHERLFKLLDVREFDLIKVLVPASTSSRSKVAAYAAEIICQNHANSTISKVDTSDLSKLVTALDHEYLDIYRRSGFNVEIGLTGSKRQAIAAAILSVTRKIAEAWYVKPGRFDEKRFTEGVGSLAFHEIRVPSLAKTSENKRGT